jgi:hypothetical protein
MGLQQITGGGVFTQRNIDAINSNFQALQGIDVWVRPQNGNNNGNGSVKYPHGSYNNAFATMGGLARVLEPGLVIGLRGVLFEEYVFPLGVNDLTVLGMGNQPRQATTGGVPNGGAATWMTPTAGATSTTTPLITMRGQATTIQNVYINSSASAAPAVSMLMNGNGDPPVDASAEHCVLRGCYVTGAHHGVTASGGPNFVTLDDCKFFGFSGGTDTAISSVVGAGVHSLYGWTIKDCEFQGNIRHISAGISGASIHGNHFTYINNGVTTAIFYDATGGSDNAVFDNTFDVNSGNAGIAAMFVLGTNDRFSGNRLSTAVTTTNFSWGDPA